MHASAQDSLPCQDVVYLKGGSIYRGTISEYKIGETLSMVTWSGSRMQIPGNVVRKVVQECQGMGSRPRAARTYDFRERAWYHSSRAAVLFGDQESGYSLQHSSGFRFNRLLSVGLGVGVENFAPGYTDPVIMPIFVEARSYLTKQRIAPFVAMGGGYSTIVHQQRPFDFWGGENNIQDWDGGWMVQGQIGYRIGNHFITYIGIHLQRLRLDWDNSAWAWGSGKGTDVHTKRRIELGIGLLL